MPETQPNIFENNQMYRTRPITIQDLESSEALALAALVLTIVKADQKISAQEHKVIKQMGIDFGDSFWPYIDHANTELVNPQFLQKAILKVTRVEVREMIFALLCDIAMVESITITEQQLLDWLAEAWELSPKPGEST